MLGLMALVILIGWIWVAKIVVTFFAAQAERRSVRVLVYIIGFPLVLLSPLADEIVAYPQVKKICKEGVALSVNDEEAKDKITRLEISPPIRVGGVLVPITYSRYAYRDTESGVVVLSYNSYRVMGGWLSRSININGYRGPWIINVSDCFPSKEGGLPKIHKFSVIN